MVVAGNLRRERRSKMIESTDQSKVMGPKCEQVAALIGNVLGRVRSMSFADWVSHQNGLVALKPQGSKEEARQCFARALTLI